MDAAPGGGHSIGMMRLPSVALVPRPRGRTLRRALRHFASRFSATSRFSRQDAGQDLVEYGLIVAFLALAAMAAMRNLETGIVSTFTTVTTSLTTPF